MLCVIIGAMQDTTGWFTRAREGERRVAVDFGHEVRIWVSAVIYAFTGMALLLIGYWLFDALHPHELRRKIFEEDNIAVAVVVGLFMLGVAVVIHGAFSS